MLSMLANTWPLLDAGPKRLSLRPTVRCRAVPTSRSPTPHPIPGGAPLYISRLGEEYRLRSEFKHEGGERFPRRLSICLLIDCTVDTVRAA